MALSTLPFPGGYVQSSSLEVSVCSPFEPSNFWWNNIPASVSNQSLASMDLLPISLTSMAPGGFKLQWFLKWLFVIIPSQQGKWGLLSPENRRQIKSFLQLETVKYFCAFGPFYWLSPFQKGSFVCCPCSVCGWQLAGLSFLGIGTSAPPRTGLCLLLGDRPTLRLWAGSRERMVWKYRAGQQHLAPRSQKERREERAQAGVCPSLGQAGTQALSRLGTGRAASYPLFHTERGISGQYHKQVGL